MSTVYCKNCGRTSRGATNRTSGRTEVKRCKYCSTRFYRNAAKKPSDKINALLAHVAERKTQRS